MLAEGYHQQKAHLTVIMTKIDVTLAIALVSAIRDA
jgi:hypothetical protein